MVMRDMQLSDYSRTPPVRRYNAVELGRGSRCGRAEWHQSAHRCGRSRRLTAAPYCPAATGLPVPNTMTFAPIGVRL